MQADTENTLARRVSPRRSLPLAALLAVALMPTGSQAQTEAGRGSRAPRPSVPASAAMQTPTQAPGQAAPAGNAENGRAWYRKAGCYQCHSDQAQGGTQGPRLGPNPMPFRGFLTYVRAPKGEMPPYTAKVLTDQDLADIYAFLRALPAPPPLDSIELLAR